MVALPPPAPPSEPALDSQIFAGLLDLISDDDDAFLVELFDAFVSTHAKSTRGMREAVLARDAEALGRHAHTLKGASANVGATHIAALAEELQQRSDLDGVQDWIEAIETEFERVLEAIRTRLPSFTQPV